MVREEKNHIKSYIKMKRGKERGIQARKQAGGVVIIIHCFLFSNIYPLTMYYLQIHF